MNHKGKHLLTRGCPYLYFCAQVRAASTVTLGSKRQAGAMPGARTSALRGSNERLRELLPRAFPRHTVVLGRARALLLQVVGAALSRWLCPARSEQRYEHQPARTPSPAGT